MPEAIAGRPAFSLPWLLAGVLVYFGVLLGAFLVLADTFSDLQAPLLQVRKAATPEEVRRLAEPLLGMAWKLLLLFSACYFAGGIALGWFSGGRPVLQAAIAAALSMGLFFLQAGLLLPAVWAVALLAVVMSGIAALGAWIGRRVKGR